MGPHFVGTIYSTAAVNGLIVNEHSKKFRSLSLVCLPSLGYVLSHRDLIILLIDQSPKLGTNYYQSITKLMSLP